MDISFKKKSSKILHIDLKRKIIWRITDLYATISLSGYQSASQRVTCRKTATQKTNFLSPQAQNQSTIIAKKPYIRQNIHKNNFYWNMNEKANTILYPSLLIWKFSNLKNSLNPQKCYANNKWIMAVMTVINLCVFRFYHLINFFDY